MVYVAPALQHLALADDGRLSDLVVANGIPPAFVPKVDVSDADCSSKEPSSSKTFKVLTKIITGACVLVMHCNHFVAS